MIMGTITLCAVIALFGALALIITPLMEKWFESKGIYDDMGVDYGEE